VSHPLSPPPALTLPAAFASEGLSLWPAGAADLAFERALFETARTDAALLAAWPEDVRRPFLDQQFQAQTVYYARAYPNAERSIILSHTEPIGRLILDRSGETWTLVDVALVPAWRGKGIGGALVGTILSAAATAGARVSLSVEVLNPARSLYERLGFVVIEEAIPHLSMQWKPQAQSNTA
jgi:GNAT superfamily N-acetyltransferase